MPPVAPNSPAERFALTMALLLQAVAARVSRPGRPGLAGPLVGAIWLRLKRLTDRFARLAARIAAGALKPPRLRPGRARRAAARPPSVLPRGFAWLIRLMPGDATRFAAAGFASQLRHLLAQPDMQALIAASPRRMGRTLRPLCHILGIDLPPELRRPPPVRTDPAPPDAPAPCRQGAAGGALPPQARPRRARPLRPARAVWAASHGGDPSVSG